MVPSDPAVNIQLLFLIFNPMAFTGMRVCPLVLSSILWHLKVMMVVRLKPFISRFKLIHSQKYWLRFARPSIEPKAILSPLGEISTHNKSDLSYNGLSKY